MFFSPWPANLKFDLSNDSCQLLSPLSGIPLAASVCQQNNCHQLRLSGAHVNAQQRPVDYARKVGEGQPELSPIFDVCTKQPAVSPQDWPRRTAAAVRECSNRPRYIYIYICIFIYMYIILCIIYKVLYIYITWAFDIWRQYSFHIGLGWWSKVDGNQYIYIYIPPKKVEQIICRCVRWDSTWFELSIFLGGF